MNVTVRSGTTALRPRARLVRLMGEELISSDAVALAELVKNAYDADAHLVEIRFEGPLEPGQGSIEVVDDGHGMSLDTILRGWLEPATNIKRAQRRSPGGRTMTGEKGIGRFAAARLARYMYMTSRQPGSRVEARVFFDWGQFEAEDLYLDQVECLWEERLAVDSAAHGTRLRLESLKAHWGETEFTSLRRELSRLISPIDSPKDFAIQLKLPAEYSHLTGEIAPPAFAGHPVYRLWGNVDASGAYDGLHYAYLGREETLGAGQIILEDGSRPRCGPFRFEFKVWDRGPNDLQSLAERFGSTVRDIRRDLDQACGIAIYRDGFRVLPYGEPNNDWLRLDLRRVKNPTLRLSNNQIIGTVMISSEGNPELRDQTNREGLIAGRAFDDLKECLIHLLAIMEKKRSEVRRPAKPVRGPLLDEINIEKLTRFAHERYPNDAELQEVVREEARRLNRGVKRVQEVLARYRRLAALGQLVDVILHEGRTPVGAIGNEVALAREDLRTVAGLEQIRERLGPRLDTIDNQTDVLRVLFQKLSPFSGRARGRPAKVLLEDIIRDAFDLLSRELKQAGVAYTLPRTATPVTADRAELQQIVVNLLDNSLYWLRKVPTSHRRIEVTVSRQHDSVQMLFCDSGPGVAEDIRDRIFDPYFSTKPDGVGLGLTIAGELALEYGGELALVSDGPLPGACFRLVLRRGVEHA